MSEVATEMKKPPRKPRPSEIAAKKMKAIKTKAAGKKVNGTAKKPVGRPFMYPDQTLVRMPKGTLKRIHAACKDGEGQGDFVRGSIMTELSKRRA